MTGHGRLVALAVAVLMALAGCATIPTSGPVRVAATEAADQPNIVFLPSPPANGATQEEIVRGFVLAGSEGGNYPVARQFLTADFARRWRPNARVLVHSDPWTPRATSSSRIVLTVPVSARVDDTGAYTAVPDKKSVAFDLVQVKGQWRITSAPDGIVLAQDVFQRIWVQEVLKFWDPTFTRLVPDPRWFPNRASQTGAVARALLAGPAAPLRGGVTRSAFPVGSRTTAVGGSTATASVALEVPGTPGATALERMGQQLRGSLPASAADVLVTVNGRVVQSVLPPSSGQQNPSPIVVAGGRFGPLTTSGVAQDPDLGKRVVALDPRAVTVSTRQGFAAVLGRGGVSVVTRGSTRLVDPRLALVDPTVDQRGWTYSVPHGDPTALKAFPTRGRPVTLSGRLPGTEVLAIEASPDGTRMLVLGQTAARRPVSPRRGTRSP